jgi:hypothetical protein
LKVYAKELNEASILDCIRGRDVSACRLLGSMDGRA